MIDDRTDLGQVPTIPDNASQSPVFGAITETTKDAFVLELRQYLETKYTKLRVGELPRIDKYSVAGQVISDPLETAVSLVRSYPDLTENLPMIAITSTVGRNRKLDISNKHTSMIVYPAAVIGTLDAPFILADGMDLSFTTTPEGSSAVISRMVFRSYMFANIAAATVPEVVAAIALQALYAVGFSSASVTGKRLGLRAGGPHGISYPNVITITGGTAAIPLGFTVAQTDQNFGVGKYIYERKHTAADLTVNIEVLAESENIRTEISDLVYDFIVYTMEDRKFQFYGRSVFDPTVLNETYQIILKDGEMSFSGESEVPRPSDPKDKIYINRLSVPVTAILYSDRRVVDKNNNPVTLPMHITTAIVIDVPEPS
jgi:hypothetical protein